MDRLRSRRSGTATPPSPGGRSGRRRSRRVEASADRLAFGVRGTVYAVGILPLAFSVTSCRPEDRTWSWQVRLGPVTLDLDHAVFPAGSGSRSTLSLAGPALVVMAYAPLARLALRRLCAASRTR